ncbi:hypothetical protein CDD83_7927 [Cordyceps sp. RAO-2017]|nr:hypothetical protein CDD83_7927 [Cordyceps sp. RAO-2017]
MNEHHLASSFGDPKAQPHTPRHTPTSATFPSPVFETPKQYQGSFIEPGGLTPRFAEEYSVFNSTPGNLRGSQGPFADFISATSTSFSGGHRRLLSAEGLAADIVAHVNHLSANSDKSFPHLDSSHRLPPSPNPLTSQKAPSTDLGLRSTPNPSRTKSVKKSNQRCTDAQQSDPPQIISPPPSSQKGGRKLAPKPDMHNDHAFGQTDLVDPTHHDMTALMASSTDLFGYPMSAPASAPANFWDPSMSLSMDLEFGVAGQGHMQPLTPSSHRHTGSFDWNADIQLFQDVTVAAPPANQENGHHVRRERTLAPKPPTSEAAMAGNACDHSASVAHPAPALDDPFGIMNPGEGVDPGLLFSRPQTSALEPTFSPLPHAGPVDKATTLSGRAASTEGVRRTNSAKSMRGGRLPDRALAGSPVKSMARPGLGRSYSENRGNRTAGRKTHPALTETGRPAPHATSGHSVLGGRVSARASGRVSPSKTMPRLSTLASIPEASPQHRPRASVRFTIDSRGRARAETTLIGEASLSDGGLQRSRSSREVGSRSWDSSDDDSSTDDEPIIIPSRNTSFNASFALPDPRKPVGSIFHASSRRSVSDRSRSTSANGAESEAETVVHERQHKGGDAMSELRRVVEDRQKRSSRMGSARSQRFISTRLGNYPGGIISPTSLTESSQGHGGHGIRCVCDDNSADEADGFMLQCESCEMWLHGKCINITRRTMPSVYICCFCAKTPNNGGRRCRESGLGIGGLLSPLATKSFRTFR